MRELRLTSGQVTIVSDLDYGYLSQFNLCLAGKGYVIRHMLVNGKNQAIYIHNEIAERMCLVLQSGEEVDHKDRIKLNNQRENLRAATRSQQMANASKRNAQTGSKYKGVSVHNNNKINPWKARIHYQKIEIALGCFATEVEAALAYDQSAKRLFGAFAKLNFP